MLTAGDALAKTLAKSQKVTFLEQKKWLWMLFFFLLTAGDALTLPLTMKLFKKSPQFIGSSISNLYLQL